ncbi:MAG: DciA family protein [Jannaschia sp.]
MATFRKGPRRVSSLVDRDIKRLSERRGFSESRLLTHWAEIAGAEIAAICRPVKVGYPRGGFGAVLTLLTTGAQAQVLQMRLPVLEERVNACYGYRAISRIAITQTAPSGFAEGQADFAPAPRARPAPPDPAILASARETARDVGDPALRGALERLAANIISKQRP